MTNVPIPLVVVWPSGAYMLGLSPENKISKTFFGSILCICIQQVKKDWNKQEEAVVAEAAKMFILENDYGSTTTSKHGGLFICMMLCVE